MRQFTDGMKVVKSAVRVASGDRSERSSIAKPRVELMIILIHHRAAGRGGSLFYGLMRLFVGAGSWSHADRQRSGESRPRAEAAGSLQPADRRTGAHSQ